jgi:hypothetical protein
LSGEQKKTVNISRLQTSRPRCVFCHDSIHEAPLICTGCRIMVHVECKVELGDCPTFGCKGEIPTAESLSLQEAPSASVKLSKAATIAMATCAAFFVGFLAWFLLFG